MLIRPDRSRNDRLAVTLEADLQLRRVLQLLVMSFPQASASPVALNAEAERLFQRALRYAIEDMKLVAMEGE